MPTLDTLTVRLTADTSQFDTGIKGAEQRVRVFSRNTEALATGGQRVKRGLDGAGKAAENVGRAARRSTGGLGRLNDSFITLAGSSVGLGSTTRRLIDVLGTFAIGVGAMIPILAGLAAIGMAYDRITRNARETKKAAEEAAEAIKAAALEEATLGQNTQITRNAAVGKQLDEIARQIREKEPFAPISTTARRRIAELRKEYDRLNAIRLQGEAMVAAAHARNQEQARKDAERASEEAKRTTRIMVTGLSGLSGTVPQIGARLAEDIDKAREELLRLQDQRAFATIQADAEALDKRIAEVTERIREMRRAFEELEMPAITVAPPSIVGTPSVTPRWRIAPEAVEGDASEGQAWDRVERRRRVAAEAAGATGPSTLSRIGSVIQAGAPGELTMMVEAVKQFGPLGLLLPVINAAFEAMAPALEAIMAPVKIVGTLLGKVLAPVVKAASEPLKLLAIVASYVVQALGWLIRGIGKAINFLLPGNPANGLVRFGQNMIDSARQVREEMNGLAKATEEVTASIRNVPLAFDAAFRRYQVGTGNVPRAAAVGGGQLNIREVHIHARDGDTGVTLWREFERAADTAAAQGNPLARSITLQRAG